MKKLIALIALTAFLFASPLTAQIGGSPITPSPTPNLTSPGAIGGTTPAAGTFTTLTATSYLNTAYATVASHATTSAIWAAAGNIINFTGGETITALPAAAQAGSQRWLICAGTPTFTHAGALTVQGGVSYTAAIGDVALVTATTTTAFKINIFKQSGLPVVLPTAIPLTSLATQNAYTINGNATAGAASPTAIASSANMTAFLGSANYSTARSNLGLGSMAEQASSDYWPKSIIDAAGDLVQGSGSDTIAKLTKGAEGTILRAGAASNAYSTSTFADTYTQYSILYAGTANTITGLASSANMVSLLGSTDYATARTNLGLGTMAVETATNYFPKSLLTEQGDVIYGSAASTPAALAHGTAGALLQTGGNAANPSWTTHTFAAPGSTGNLLVSDGTNWTAGTAIPSTPIFSNGSTSAGFSQFQEKGAGTDKTKLKGAEATTGDIEVVLPATAGTLARTEDITASVLNFATTGTIQGGIKISSDADGMDAAAMTAAGMYGTLFIATGAGTWILPTAVAGMSACLLSAGAAANLILDVTANDYIILNGTTLVQNAGITQAVGKAAGDFVCVVATAASYWTTLGIKGLWLTQ